VPAVARKSGSTIDTRRVGRKGWTTDQFSIAPSSTPLHSTADHIETILWDPASVPGLLTDTPEFYQRLIGPLPALPEQLQLELIHGLELETLAACSDGSVADGTGAHGWIFANDSTPVLQGAGPDDRHPDHMTSYRSELGGLLAVLYLIYRVCSYYEIQTGKLLLYCDNKGALQNVFHSKGKPGITPFMDTDSELVEAARLLVSSIPITIMAEWVKGHKTGPLETKHKLNHKADQLAGSFSKNPPHKFKAKHLPVAPPHYRVRLLYDNSVLTSKVYQVLSSRLHSTLLRAHIIKKGKWSQPTFDLINWEAHGSAFRCLTRDKQISTAKLIHQLNNTNRQNHLYYNTSATCPCCQEHEETCEHVLTCLADDVHSHREEATQELATSLTKLATPSPVVEAILHGTRAWINYDPHHPRHIRAPVAGSLRAADVLLTSAFHEQFHTIGWFHLFLGRISTKWDDAVRAYSLREGRILTANHWSSQAIHFLWRFTRSMWAHRNGIVHGVDAQSAAARILQDLQDRVRTLYKEYDDNPQMILSTHSHLFTSRTLDQRLKHNYDNLTCWLRSVSEARLDLAHHVRQLREQSSQFFTPAQFLLPQSQDDDSMDSSYTGSTHHSSTTNTTLFTTTTQDTSSSNTSTTSSQLSINSLPSNGYTGSGTSDPPSIISWRDDMSDSTF
jgi:hypothetical protein